MLATYLDRIVDRAALEMSAQRDEASSLIQSEPQNALDHYHTKQAIEAQVPTAVAPQSTDSQS